LKMEINGKILIEEIDDSLIKESLDSSVLEQVWRYSAELDNFFGSAQDIEWAVNQNKEVLILQSRPLKLFRKVSPVALPEISEENILIKGGVTASQGAGAGKVFYLKSVEDLAKIEEGTVLVTESPFPGLVAVLGKVSALVTKVGGIASHLVTVAREYRIPTLVGVENCSLLKTGMEVTVSASEAIIFSGIHSDYISAVNMMDDVSEEDSVLTKLRNSLPALTHLNLIDSNSSDFSLKNCCSYHDIIRYVHQKAVNAMFDSSSSADRSGLGVRLKSEIPLVIEVINLDEGTDFLNKKHVTEKDIHSAPFQSFWSGAIKAGWMPPPASDLKSMMSVVATDMTNQKTDSLAEKSYAVVSRDYMVLSLRMGYHFSTISSICSDNTNRNFIKMTFKEGGASIEKRIRRIKLITDLLTKIGFSASSKGDFFSAFIEYTDLKRTEDMLFKLGQITMLTKQLDVALSDDEDVQDYTEEFSEILFKGEDS
jgi:pyruvate, water dikinase